jgi:hypothetical protein
LIFFQETENSNHICPQTDYERIFGTQKMTDSTSLLSCSPFPSYSSKTSCKKIYNTPSVSKAIIVANNDTDVDAVYTYDDSLENNNYDVCGAVIVQAEDGFEVFISNKYIFPKEFQSTPISI